MKNNAILLIVILIGAVVVQVVALACTISFTAVIDDGKNSLYSLIILVAAILFQILITVTIGSGIYAYWFRRECTYSVLTVIPLLSLGSVLHLAAAIMMVVSTVALSESERGHIAYGGFIASLDFISFGLQIIICIVLSCSMYKQYQDKD